MRVRVYADFDVPDKDAADAYVNDLSASTGQDFTWEDTTPEWNMD